MATAPTNFRLAAVQVSPPATEIFPLSIHASGRYLVDAQGDPFFVHGDTPWSFAVRLTDAEIDDYLDDRQAKGFTALLCYPIEHEYNDGVTPAYENVDGQNPFTTMTNWASPNDTYWDRVDHFIDGAKARDMLVILNPAFFGFGGGSQGWSSEISAESDADLQTYGQFLANRYTQGNILWFWGGDYDGDSTLRAKQRQILTGLRSVRTTDLNSFHPAPNQHALEVVSTTDYPNFVNWAYAYEKDGEYPYAQVAQAYAVSGPVPVVLMEANYEDEFSVTAAAIRRQAYTAVLAGACGHVYGHGIVWPFLSGWETALDDTGAVEMQHVVALFSAYEWWKLAPETGSGLVTSSKGSGTSVITPALASDGSFGMAYVPSSQTVTFDMSALSPSSVRVRLYDPTTGSYSTVSGSPFANSGTQGIATGGERVVVLDAEP